MGNGKKGREKGKWEKGSAGEPANFLAAPALAPNFYSSGSGSGSGSGSWYFFSNGSGSKGPKKPGSCEVG